MLIQNDTVGRQHLLVLDRMAAYINLVSRRFAIILMVALTSPYSESNFWQTFVDTVCVLLSSLVQSLFARNRGTVGHKSSVNDLGSLPSKVLH